MQPMSSGSESAPESDSANSSNFGEIPSDEEVSSVDARWGDSLLAQRRCYLSFVATWQKVGGAGGHVGTGSPCFLSLCRMNC